MSEDDDGDPLEKLHVSKDEINRQQLYEALEGLIQIIEESGDPRPRQSFEDLSNKQRFVALMLYRRAAVELGHLDPEKVGADSSWFTEYVDVDDSRIRQYAGELSFVENEPDRGGYYIPGFGIEAALNLLSDGDN